MEIQPLSPCAYDIMGTCHVSLSLVYLCYCSPMDRLCFVISSLLNLLWCEFLWCDFHYDQVLSIMRLPDVCNFIGLHHFPIVPMRCFFLIMKSFCMISQYPGTFIIDKYFIYIIYHQTHTVSNVKKLEYS
jgi:hypothetical protein